MNTGSPSFTVICGLDGSGKTSVIERLQRDYPEYHCSHWSQLREDRGRPGWFHLGDDPAVFIHTLSPMQRALYVASIVWQEYECLIRPYLLVGKRVISDSYYFKFWAKETAYGRAHPLLYQLLKELPEPDEVILIDASPEVVYQRKQVFTPYEVEGSPSRANCIRFQSEVRAQLLQITGQIVRLSIIDGDEDLETVYQKVLEQLRR